MVNNIAAHRIIILLVSINPPSNRQVKVMENTNNMPSQSYFIFISSNSHVQEFCGYPFKATTIYKVTSRRPKSAIDRHKILFVAEGPYSSTFIPMTLKTSQATMLPKHIKAGRLISNCSTNIILNPLPYILIHLNIPRSLCLTFKLLHLSIAIPKTC